MTLMRSTLMNADSFLSALVSVLSAFSVLLLNPERQSI
jgi:hypothetical protein